MDMISLQHGMAFKYSRLPTTKPRATLTLRLPHGVCLAHRVARGVLVRPAAAFGTAAGGGRHGGAGGGGHPSASHWFHGKKGSTRRSCDPAAGSLAIHNDVMAAEEGRWVDQARRLAELGFPVTVVEVGMVMMSVTDTMMVGHLSEVALGAVALGHSFSWVFICFGCGTLSVLDPIFSQAFGAGDKRALAAGLQRGVIMAVVLAVPVVVAMCCAGPALAALGQPTELIGIASQYSTVCSFSVVPFLMFSLLRQLLQGIGKAGPIVTASVVANVANVVLNHTFINGCAALGIPQLGAIGSAYATVASRWFLLGSVLWASCGTLGQILEHSSPKDLRNFAPLAKMAALGLPMGLQQFFEWASFSCLAILMGRLGTVAVAGFQVASGLTDVTYMVPLGISAATSVLVGQAVGRGQIKDADLVCRVAMVATLGFTTLCGLAFCLFPEAIARQWCSSGPVVAIAVRTLPMVGAFQILDGCLAIVVAALRGAGRTNWAFFSSAAGFWLVGLPSSVLLAFNVGMGPAGLWLGMSLGLACSTAMCLAGVIPILAGTHAGRRMALS